jgi:mRNA interferase MazF
MYDNCIWVTRAEPASNNGLTKDSAADAFRMRSVSLERFTDKTGRLPEAVLRHIARAIALIVDSDPRF